MRIEVQNVDTVPMEDKDFQIMVMRTADSCQDMYSFRRNQLTLNRDLLEEFDRKNI